MAGVDKTFAPVRGQPLVAHTLDRFEQFPPVTEIVLVVSADSWELGCALVRRRKYRKVSQVCVGGARRQDSVRAGLDALQPCDWVMVHDGARPRPRPGFAAPGAGRGCPVRRRSCRSAGQGHYQGYCPQRGNNRYAAPGKPSGRRKPPRFSATTCSSRPTPNSPAKQPTTR